MTYLSKTLVWCPIALWASAMSLSAQETPEKWYDAGQQRVERNLSFRSEAGSFPTAKNVILFVGDGMGISTVTAARIMAGQLEGNPGEEHELFFETFPNVALSKTYNTNAQVPDSAGTMSAMVTGVKTDRGIISVNQYASRGDCDSVNGNIVETFLEKAERKGMSTGVVTTARVTHATPAANYSHSMERDHEDDRDASRLRNAGDCPDIARQLIEFTENVPGSDGLEVVLGGGRRSFMPRAEYADPETGQPGERLDNRNLILEWTEKYENSAYAWNKEQFDSIDPNTTDHLLGLFNSSHMQYSPDINEDVGGEPTLTEMTAKAIEILQRNENGFYLNVEAGRIDHAHHAQNPYRALYDTIELAKAVKIAYEMVNLEETLIIVTADHSHVFTIAGYPKRGNPILGKVVGTDPGGEPKTEPTLAMDELPYTTLGYANGRVNPEPPEHDASDTAHSGTRMVSRNDLSQVDTTRQDFRPEALIPMRSETHAGEDVAIYAAGPGSDLIRGVMEQHVIFHVMMEATKMATPQ